MKKTQCLRQISDTLFEETSDFVNELEVYEGELVYKRNNKYYLSLGYDALLEYEVYIPIYYKNNQLNNNQLNNNQLNIVKLGKYSSNIFN
jgi:hypothetical protein